jgi:hypothetical protein
LKDELENTKRLYSALIRQAIDNSR